MRIAIIIAVIATMLASCATPHRLAQRIRKHPDRYVEVINALKDAAASGDTIAMQLADVIAPPPDTVVVVRADTVMAEVVDTVTVPVVTHDTVAVVDTVSWPVDTVVSDDSGRARVRVYGRADSLVAEVVTVPVVVRTRTVTVTRDSVVRVPEVRYVGVPATEKERYSAGIPRWLYLLLWGCLGFVLGEVLSVLRGRRR